MNRVEQIRAECAAEAEVNAAPCNPIFMSDIIAEVAVSFGVTVDEIKSRSRLHKYVFPRQACIWLGKKLTSHSYPRLARAVNRNDHSTAMHAVRMVEIRMAFYPEYRAYVDAARIRLMSGFERREKRLREAVERMMIRARMEREAREASQSEEPDDDDLDDMEMISRAVARHYAGLSA